MISCPSLLKDYNMNMNCVDKFDRCEIKMYHIEKKKSIVKNKLFIYYLLINIGKFSTSFFF